MVSVLELMEYHVHVLFKHDAHNRLTVVNEPPYDSAPHVFVGHTELGKVVKYYSSALSAELIGKLEQELEAIPADRLSELIEVLRQDHHVNDVWTGPAYVFSALTARTLSKAIQITNQNKDLLKSYFPYTFQDFADKQPCFVIIENNVPVSICCSARQTPKAAEASLFTHEKYRGRGLAVQVANAWALEVQKQGRIALYSTSEDNISSRALARKLELIQFGTDFHIG
ncbi:GNAT family N-acetyltransferase [Peribacillus sp. SCS-155]|uniref:GNAT family N-acetyltransferase n=1 Tax=Peribacillus sedimenti TaxID=3115297 RepID=UPI003906B373